MSIEMSSSELSVGRSRIPLPGEKIHGSYLISPAKILQTNFSFVAEILQNYFRFVSGSSLHCTLQQQIFHTGNLCTFLHISICSWNIILLTMMHDPGINTDVTLQLIALLGDTLARVQAAQAKEEYALSQIVASLKFVNHTVDSWVNSSQEEAESSQFHVYESDLSAVSQSIDAVLGEARLVRGGSKRANPKGVTSTPDNAIAHKFKVAEQKKKTLERFSQALHMEPTKTIGTDLGDRHSSFSAAHEMLLRWIESKDQRSFHIVAKKKHEKAVERSNPARSFLDSLWAINGNPAVSETKVGNVPGGDLIEMTCEDDGSSTAPPLKQVDAVRHVVQRNVEELQALCKLIRRRHLYPELLSSHMTIFNAVERDRHHFGNEEESAEGSLWLPAGVCWRVLGTQGKGFTMEHEMQVLPTLYSHLQQPLATMRLIHSIHTNIFHCHLQAVLAQCFFLKSSSQSSRRIHNVLSNSSDYLCFRLAHCLVCNNGKALFTVANRVDVT